MRLELDSFHARDIAFSDTTRLGSGTLYINKEELKRLVLEDDHFVGVEIDVVRPGDRTRIINILDVVEPRHKVEGPGTVFPGALGPPITVGQGKDHRLTGMALITTSEPAQGEAVHWRDGIIDMSGPGALYSPFSGMVNLVLQFKGKEDFSKAEAADLVKEDVIRGSRYSRQYNFAARVAGFKVANYLASATRGLRPDSTEVYQLSPVDPSLPRVAYTCQITVHWLYGAQLGWQPTLLHPNEMMDGALFNSFIDVASDRDPTFFFQNNPVVESLYRRHGADINFVGVLLYPHGGERIPDKERITGYGAKLLKMLGVQGVVMTWNGAGHPGIDIMLLCQKCERLGIKTTILNPEMARTPDDPGFVHYVPEADAVISTGNYERPITLPAVERVVGGERLSIPEIDASQELPLSIRYLYAATATLGVSRLAGVQY